MIRSFLNKYCFYIYAIGLSLLPMTSFGHGTKVVDIPQKKAIQKHQQQWKIGKVHYLKFEGGFYGIVTNQSEKLLPMNLPKEYRLEGTVLALKGDLIKDMLTTQQWGKPFKINQYKVLELGADANTQ